MCREMTSLRDERKPQAGQACGLRWRSGGARWSGQADASESNKDLPRGYLRASSCRRQCSFRVNESPQKLQGYWRSFWLLATPFLRGLNVSKASVRGGLSVGKAPARRAIMVVGSGKGDGKRESKGPQGGIGALEEPSGLTWRAGFPTEPPSPLPHPSLPQFLWGPLRPYAALAGRGQC